LYTAQQFRCLLVYGVGEKLCAHSSRDRNSFGTEATIIPLRYVWFGEAAALESSHWCSWRAAVQRVTEKRDTSAAMGSLDKLQPMCLVTRHKCSIVAGDRHSAMHPASMYSISTVMGSRTTASPPCGVCGESEPDQERSPLQTYLQLLRDMTLPHHHALFGF
jgi:hypothetical protein